MSKGMKKKKNRKLRRQIRKTFGALLMISAIVVAALPVQDVSADDGTGGAKIQVLNYTSAAMTAWESLTNTTGAVIPGTVESACQSMVPYVDPGATIYTTGDGRYQFAFVKPSATSADEVAVILGANVTNLANNSLTIPSMVDAYKKYTANTTSTGYCAVSRNGNYLYYLKSVQKEDANRYPLYKVPQLSGTTLDKEFTTFELQQKTQNDDGTWNYVYLYDTGDVDTDGNKVYEEYAAVPVMVDSCVPCYYNSINDWVGLADNELYYWNGTGAIDPYDTDSFRLTQEVENQRIHDADVQYIGRQYLLPNPSTAANQSEWIIGGLVEEANRDQGVFAGKGQIVNLTIGDNLLGIGDYAFYGCSGLNSVTLGNGLSTIGNGAFSDCVNLKECNMQLNSQIAAIGESAFSNCRGLTSMTIPVNVRAVGDYCFEGCTGLQTVELCGNGSNVLLEVIGYKAFRNCSSLTSITFPNNYVDCETGTEDGASVTGIPISYFEGCTSLQYIKVQNNVFTFLEGNHAQHGSDPSCDIDEFLESVSSVFYFEGPDVSAIHTTAKNHSGAFKYLNEDKFEKTVVCSEEPSHESTFIVNSSNQLIDMEIDPDCGVIEIPANIGAYGIETIGSTSFKDNCFLKKVIIPSTVKYIEANAFRGCHNLQDVIFSQPCNIISIGEGAFDTQVVDLHKTGCPNEGTFLTSAPTLTFTGDISLTSEPFRYAMDPGNNINAGAQPITYITYYSGWPTNLTVQYNPDTDKNELLDYPRYDELANYDLTSYPYMTQEYVDAAKKAVSAYETPNPQDPITQNQLEIVNSALNINLPAGIESIATGIFSGKDSDYENVSGQTVNDKIQTITMNTVEELEPYTFADCKSLTGFYMSGGNKIDDYVFKDCEALTNVSLAPTVTEIGLRPFVGCKALQQIDFQLSPYFSCEGQIIFGLSNGTKTSVVECLESRGDTAGNTKVGPDELAGVTTVSNEAFKNCDGIGSVDFSTSSLTSVPEQCFAQTDRLYSVILPDTTKSIRKGAFWNSKVSYMEIPASVTLIEPEAFANVETTDGDDEDGEIALDTDGDPTVKNKTSGHSSISFYCAEDSAADTYADNYYYINVTDERPAITHTVYFWDYPNYPDTTQKAVYETQEVVDGEDAVPPIIPPSHTGYTFTGWTDYFAISRDTDVYPQFGSAVYSVQFLDYDGTPLCATQYIDEGKSATPPADPTREGYTFTGWSQEFYNVKGDLVIVAQYSDNSGDANRHTVTFYAYDGTTVVSEQKVDDGGSAIAPVPPTRSGYTFVAWVPATFTNVTKDMSIVASYEPSGGTTSASASPSGGTATGSASPSSSASPTTSPGVVTYTVSVSGGSGSGSYAAGQIVAINAYDMGEGQNFDKWTTSTAGVGFANASATSTTFTMPAANVAITATYKTGSGTTTAATGSTGGGTTPSGNNNSGTTVDVDRPGISNTNLAGATVSGSTDNFVVKITETQEASDAVVSALQAKFGDISRIKYLAMDISLYDSTGRTKIADTSGLSVNITLPLPDDLIQYAGNNKIAAVVNGAVQDLDARFTTVDGVPCINFTATHFSPYTIYVDTSNLTEATIDSTPKTGDPIHPKWFLAIGLACISLILFFKRDRVIVGKAA